MIASRSARWLDPRRILGGVLVPVLALALAFLLGAIAIVAAGASPIEAYGELIRGAVGSPQNVAATLVRSIPIAVAGVGLAVAFRAGAFNLGGEGQMILGALATAVVAGVSGGLPAVVAIPLALAAGMAAGAAWAILPAWLQVKVEVPLLIITLLLNYVAILLASYLVTYPLRDLTGAAVPQTATIPANASLPILIGGTRLHLGVIAVVLVPLAVLWLQRRTVLGYELRMTGANPEFAAYGGIRTGRMTITAMGLSGGLCGLAGALLVAGLNHRFIDQSINGGGYAWTGFIAALLAAANPILTVFAGIFLAALDVGAAGMARNTDVPLQLIDVVQAAVIFVLAVRITLREFIARRLARR
ncbi:MAG: ral nucleoside transport system permease protein [Chloroflexota bacterium]|nr:ral nucleoside transport system permease protein [Chloroflexota bacterium]